MWILPRQSQRDFFNLLKILWEIANKNSIEVLLGGIKLQDLGKLVVQLYDGAQYKNRNGFILYLDSAQAHEKSGGKTREILFSIICYNLFLRL